MKSAILSSKLYKLSKRKSKIIAAVDDPINLELVKQLSSYISDPSLIDDSDGESTDKNDVKDKGHSIKPSESSGSGGGGGFSSSPEFDDSSSDSDLAELTDEFESERSDVVEPNLDNDVEESTSVSGESIVSSLTTSDKIIDSYETIQGLLNSRQESTGVVRMSVEDGQLWVYYGGDVNLNDVMEPAINLLNAAGYTSLYFKKLSRPENALTFDISSIPGPVKPMESTVK